MRNEGNTKSPDTRKPNPKRGFAGAHRSAHMQTCIHIYIHAHLHISRRQKFSEVKFPFKNYVNCELTIALTLGISGRWRSAQQQGRAAFCSHTHGQREHRLRFSNVLSYETLLYELAMALTFENFCQMATKGTQRAIKTSLTPTPRWGI